MYFMSVNAAFAVAARTRKVSRRPCTCPTTGNILILHKTLYGGSNSCVITASRMEQERSLASNVIHKKSYGTKMDLYPL